MIAQGVVDGPRGEDGPSWTLSVRREGRCLRAEVGGWVGGVDDVLGFFRAIAAAVRETHCDSLLVLDDSRGVVPPEQELQGFVAALDGEGLERVRVAYVDVRATAIGRMEVAEIIARSHGYLVKVFDSERTARLWLRYVQH